MIETDLSPLRICKLENVVISELHRLKSNEWAPEPVNSFSCTPGQDLLLMVSFKDRFPISGLKAEVITACPLDFETFPVGRIYFPEEDTLLQDILKKKQNHDFPANSTNSIILKASIPENLPPAINSCELKLISESHSEWKGQFELEIINSGVKPAFYEPKIVFWPHWQTFCSHLNLKLWSEEFWLTAEKYLKEMAAGGMNVIMASINSDPFRYPLPESFYKYNFYPGMVEWQKNKDGSFSFDYSIYDRYIELNMALGIDKEIECHSLLPCKKQKPYLSYYNEKTNQIVEFETNWESIEYQEAWQAFIKDFAIHNKERGWLELITICPYDEPQDIESFRGVAEMVKAIAPEIRISAAISAEKTLELLDCIDIATLHLENSFTLEKLETLRKHNLDVRYYSCCTPDWGNTLFASDLIESWRIPWICYANGFNGYLRWSIIDWPDNIWENPAFNWPTGDMFLLYPDKKAPISSLRWEIFKTGIKDLKLFIEKLNSASPDQKEKMESFLAEIGIPAPLKLAMKLADTRNKLCKLISWQSN
jgi:hypothetical protein